VSSSVTGALSSSLPVGINPFWKLSFIFKCLTDSVVLDDFKTALDRLRAFKMSRLGSFAADNADSGQSQRPRSASGWPGSQERKQSEMSMPSPDGDDLSHSKPWSTGKPGTTSKPEGSIGSHREKSKITEKSSDLEVARDASGSPILRPQSSWLRDSSEGDYAQAIREVTESSHSDGPRAERDTTIGRAR
jgi:hypothetical protein